MRELLTRSAATGLGLALLGSVVSIFGTSSATAAAPGTAAGYGPLIPDPNHVLSLPSGFRNQVVSQAGVTQLQTGQPSPDRPDGTASFPRRGGGSVLVQNHEISATASHPVRT